LFLLDNGGNESLKDQVDFYVGFNKNMGIHALWNTALALAESEYFITTDNDIYVPKLGMPDWLSQLVSLIDSRPNYGAISLHPHVFIGAAGIDPKDPEDIKERNMCGAVMRIMRRDAVTKAGGWEHKIEAGRNHEESTICSRLQTAGYKVGITSRIRAFHPFPPNWGYPPEFTPEMQKHRAELEPYVQSFGNMKAYNNDTWLQL
jgi:GT2 family glycosyltransferase